MFNAITSPLYWLYERRLQAAIREGGRLPNHIGIIMDGNRRFAKIAGVDVKRGHDYGASKAREVLDWCLELRISHVTLWGFSSENRGRATDEVEHLHRLFAQQARDLVQDSRLHENQVRVRIIGDVSDFPEDARAALRAIEEATSAYEGMQLNVALGYGGREEIVQAKEEVQAIRSEYGVESRDELEASLSDEDVSAAEARDRQQSLREWEEVADELQLLEHALGLYDDLHDVDPYVEGRTDEESPETRVA
jgi:short-chain Z-isoprenyl diphosphate synthase